MVVWFNRFIQISDDTEKNQFRENMTEAGFSAVNQWLRSFYDHVKNMDEQGFKSMREWLELGKEVLPELGQFSPSWQNTWQELFDLYQIKTEAYASIPDEQRDGEWQVLFDNPFSTDGIVCHSNKTFAEATYLFAKYRLTLKKAEYVKLQKVVTSMVQKG